LSDSDNATKNDRELLSSNDADNNAVLCSFLTILNPRIDS